MKKSFVSDNINETIFNNSNQFLSNDKGDENIIMRLNDDMMKVLDDSSKIDLQFCISRETLNQKLKSAT